MSAPPSYHTSPSFEDLDPDIKNLSIQDQKDLESSSVHSGDSTVPPYSTSFNPSKTFRINARGVELIHLPIPSKELEIPIYNSDGSLAYTSTREKRSSGNAILSAPGRGDLVASNYKFGPMREPTMTMLQGREGVNEVLVSGKWTSRTQRFSYAAVPINFDWVNRKELVQTSSDPSATMANEMAEKDGSKSKDKTKKCSLLVLEVQGKDKDDITRVARLLRDEENRTAGTGYMTAGKGGALAIDELAAKGLGIPEELIVASCIMMLKKELDRRRAAQFAMMAGAASGGS
ncbi:hypothetical protein BT63DRAFT_295490 [Microthyrium microscopicum]|uniref:Uncharacterized protein n=1 Tax=Microthyrium microscopicum TaxID=703497 RepID=A0A6A6U5N5_9PEZI|nr:hypothetical protein BT63DRAFT_295490 [Microthyrium microscopicum]